VTDIAIGLTTNTGSYGDVDDAYAIYRILLEHIQDRVNIIAIVVQFGNTDKVNRMFEKLLTLVRLMDLPINKPPALLKGPSTPYGSGMMDMGNQITDLIQIVHNNPKPVTVIGIGPATTITYLMEDDAAASNVDKIYLEMGQYGSEWGQSCGFVVCGKPVGDFNFRTDIAAVQQLLELCPTKLYFTPFQIIEPLKMDDWNVMQFLRSKVDVEMWLAKGTDDWFEQWTTVFECQDFIHIWDTVPLLIGSDILYNSCTFVKVTAEVHPCGESSTPVMNTSLALTDYSGSGEHYSMVCPNYRYKPTILAGYQY
jgi:inosine-uridine nucleoside N-ribohydrolase